jgi:anti-sigma factor RsiW
MLAPDDRTLRDYLLGNLSPDRAGPVTDWLSSDPSAADACLRFAADDPLTTALAEASSLEGIPASSVEPFVRSVLQELGSAHAPDPAAGSARCNDLAQHASPSTTPFPAKLASYRLLREIGRGGMGVVHEAEVEILRRRVAV